MLLAPRSCPPSLSAPVFEIIQAWSHDHRYPLAILALRNQSPTVLSPPSYRLLLSCNVSGQLVFFLSPESLLCYLRSLVLIVRRRFKAFWAIWNPVSKWKQKVFLREEAYSSFLKLCENWNLITGSLCPWWTFINSRQECVSAEPSLSTIMYWICEGWEFRLGRCTGQAGEELRPDASQCHYLLWMFPVARQTEVCSMGGTLATRWQYVPRKAWQPCTDATRWNTPVFVGKVTIIINISSEARWLQAPEAVGEYCSDGSQAIFQGALAQDDLKDSVLPMQVPNRVSYRGLSSPQPVKKPLNSFELCV